MAAIVQAPMGYQNLDPQEKQQMLTSLLGTIGASLLQRPTQGQSFLNSIGTALGAGAQQGQSLLGQYGEAQNQKALRDLQTRQAEANITGQSLLNTSRMQQMAAEEEALNQRKNWAAALAAPGPAYQQAQRKELEATQKGMPGLTPERFGQQYQSQNPVQTLLAEMSGGNPLIQSILPQLAPDKVGGFMKDIAVKPETDVFMRGAAGDPMALKAIELKAGVAKAGRADMSALRPGTKEYLYGQTVSQYDNDDTVKQFRKTQQVTPYIAKAKELYKQTGNSGLLQDALIYTHNKTLDADSVVMVSEYLRSKGQASLLDRFQGSVNKAIEGSAGLGPEQQKIMVDAIDSALKKKAESYNQRVGAYRKKASRYGIGADELKDMFPTSNEIFGAADGTSPTGQPVPTGSRTNNDPLGIR